MSVYRSKIGFAMFLPLIIIGILTVVLWYADADFSGLIILLCTTLFILSFFNTSYTITDNKTLKIKCSIFVNIEIAVSAIKRIEKTTSILSSPALSMDRIEIFYGKFDSVMISPKQKQELVAELKAINPAIDTQKV
ncbi:MAG: hypothetical protein EOP46_11130 [Sphingobacteriaceae bacterium]|nr:MAG: hypothetical protein EOP46_11130 [Sphingobacteriaceae bacterium]